MIGALLFLAVVVGADEAPHAPALAASDWPIAHSSTWNSDLSSLPGPSRNAQSVQLLINGENITDMYDILELADPITLVQSPTKGYVWGSSVSSVFQLHIDGDNMSIINTLFRDMNFEYHGAYCLLAKDGTYFAASRTSIQAYNNEVPFDFTTPIIMTAEYFVTDMEDDEHIVGLTMTHDDVDRAHLIYATTRGQVGGVSLDFSHTTNRVTIPGIESVEMPDHFVSNSIAMDGPEGGIYVCTSNSLARVQWSGETQSLSLAWNTIYGSGYDEWYWGRLGPGCGTSPTLMGPTGKPEYVVITDGVSPMNIRFYDVHSGVNVATHPVTFGTDLNTTTDQSIVVMGYRAVVVNNWIADSVTSLCSEWFASTNASVALKHECPFLFGAYVNGIEQFELDPNTNTVVSSWANSETSCTSSIPVVSQATSTLHCLGKRTSKLGRDTYTIESIDWSTGLSLYYTELGSSLLANSLYAATEIGSSDDIVMGTLAGVVRVWDSGKKERTIVNRHGAILKVIDE